MSTAHNDGREPLKRPQIYNVDHFFGFFSAFNADAVKDVQLFKGAFPAKYGGRLSSVVDLTGKTGDPNNYHGNFGINLLNARAGVQIPLFKKRMILLSEKSIKTIKSITNSQYLDLCEYIQKELERIGLKVTIDVVPPSTLRQMKSSGELDIFRASWIADYPDAENYLSLFYSENFTPNGPNYTHFKNSTYDSLYISSLSVSNIDDRKLLYEKMDSIIINEAPVVPLYYDMAVRFVNKKVTGLGINPQNLLVLKRVKKSN